MKLSNLNIELINERIVSIMHLLDADFQQHSLPLPTIQWVRELDDDGLGVYLPKTNTICIAQDAEMMRVLVHELTHFNQYTTPKWKEDTVYEMEYVTDECEIEAYLMEWLYLGNYENGDNQRVVKNFLKLLQNADVETRKREIEVKMREVSKWLKVNVV